MRRRLRAGSAVVGVLTLLAASAASPAQAHTSAARSLTRALRADGSLRHVDGSFYAHGYRMVLGPRGAPRFVKVRPAIRPNSGPAPGPRATASRSAPFSAGLAADTPWRDSFDFPGLSSGSVSAVAVSGANVYVGGTFTTISADAGVVYNNVAWWDGHAWRPLATGTNAAVSAIAVSGSKVYIGGSFTTAGGVSASAVAVWNGTGFTPLAAGVTNPTSGGTPSVDALAVSGTTVYAGGNFDRAGTAVAHSLAAWNGTTWAALGTGVISCVYFDQPNHCFSATSPNGTVNALAVSGSTLYVGGSFDYVGGQEVFDLAAWNGTAWSKVGGLGVSTSDAQGTVNALTLNGSTLYVGGRFDHVGGSLSASGTTVTGAVPAMSVAAFNGTAWSALRSGADTCSGCSPANVTGLAYWNGKLYMAGAIHGAGGDATPLIGQWNGATWSPVGPLDGGSSDSAVLAAAPAGVVAGGTFLSAGAGATLLNRVGLWNGAAWSGYGAGLSSTGTGSGQISALAASNHDLYAGGSLVNAGWKRTSDVAHLTSSGWSLMGTGVSGGSSHVSAIAISGTNVYVGGTFSQAGAVPAANIAMWDGTAWHAVGTGTDGAVYALLVYNGKLWAGGAFTHAGGKAASDVATWNLPGGGWNPVGGDPNYDNGDVHALAGLSSPYNHYVAIGGGFSYLDDGAGGSVPVNGLALFDTTAAVTAPLDGYSLFPGASGSVGVTATCSGSTCPGVVDALYADGTKVYVGGDFDDAGAVASRGFAAYDLLAAKPGGWSSPGTVGGGSGRPTVAAITKIGSSLYIAGDFTTAGTATASDIARYIPVGGTWAALGSGLGLAGFFSPTALSLAQSADGLYAGGTFGTAGVKPSENLALWTQTASTLRATELASPVTATADTPITFTTTVKNTATVSATGVILTDTLPTASAQYVSGTPSQGSCTLSAKTLSCALGTLAAGASATVAVMLTPIAPGSLSNSVSVRRTGSTDTGLASATATVIAATRTSYVWVRDASLLPNSVVLTPGQKVQFAFFGPSTHSAFDASPLALFDSGLRSPLDYYSFQYTAGGTYPVHDAGSAHATSVAVTDVLTPTSLGHGSPVTVRMSSVTPAAGSVLDLQVLLPGASTWTSVKSGIGTATTTYTPAAAGVYQLRSRLRLSSGSASLFGPGATLVAT